MLLGLSFVGLERLLTLHCSPRERLNLPQSYNKFHDAARKIQHWLFNWAACAAVEQALTDFEAKAAERGYDGMLGVEISHPTVVDGGVEVVVYGNGFRTRSAE